jgi:CheY-like chemotaxis protein
VPARVYPLSCAAVTHETLSATDATVRTYALRWNARQARPDLSEGRERPGEPDRKVAGPMEDAQRKPARIVLVEDNPGDVRLMRLALDDCREPYTLEVLSDGEAALRFVREQCRVNDADDPCLVVLDLHLPRLDGQVVLRALRGEPSLNHVRVAVLTTQASPQEEAEVLALGVHLYRRKPSDIDAFVALAGELLALCHDPNPRAAVTGQ